jgi:hypothetical protein
LELVRSEVSVSAALICPYKSEFVQFVTKVRAYFHDRLPGLWDGTHMRRINVLFTFTVARTSMAGLCRGVRWGGRCSMVLREGPIHGAGSRLNFPKKIV